MCMNLLLTLLVLQCPAQNLMKAIQVTINLAAQLKDRFADPIHPLQTLKPSAQACEVLGGLCMVSYKQQTIGGVYDFHARIGCLLGSSALSSVPMGLQAQRKGPQNKS